jgi:hypothetical protein
MSDASILRPPQLKQHIVENEWFIGKTQKPPHAEAFSVPSSAIPLPASKTNTL